MDTLIKLRKTAEKLKEQFPGVIVIQVSCGYCEVLKEDAEIVSKVCGTAMATTMDGEKITGFLGSELKEMASTIVKSGHEVLIIG